MALQGHPVELGRPKAVWAAKTSKIEFREPDGAARKALRGHGRFQGAMEDANMVHNRHQSTLRHTFGWEILQKHVLGRLDVQE